MLVCPQCQFENPDSHRFCQKCGASLTDETERTPLPELLSTSSDDEEFNPSEVASDRIWRAILFPTEPALPDLELSSKPPIELDISLDVDSDIDVDADIPAEAQKPSQKSSQKQYLDPQHRYLLLEPLPEQPITQPLEVRVLDCEASQPSSLEILLQQAGNELSMSSIPALAQPYLFLAVQHECTALPQIHDAWEQDGEGVILLEDRLSLPTLASFWADDRVLPLQVLRWLYEMTELWALLMPYDCCQSLLDLNNLRIDEDQVICLQRLNYEPLDLQPQLKSLGQLWQLLFQQSQRTQIGSLVRLCYELEAGTITDFDELRSRLEAIADELKPDTFTPMPDFPASFDPTTEKDGVDLPARPPELGSETAPPPADFSASASPTRLEPFSASEEVTAIEGDDSPTVVLPMRLVSLQDAGRTDIGRQREHNEDFFSIQTELKKVEVPQGRTLKAKGLYILCDGMGGHEGGEVASALAVNTLKEYFEKNWQDQLPSEEKIRESIQLANQAIYDLNQHNSRSGSGRMGTTLVMVLIQDTEAAIAHVGDSRLYRFSRRRGLEQVTVDHEVGQREIQRGVEPTIAYARPDAYQLTQALGPRDENFINPDVEFLELNEDMLLVLCSDGLTDNDLLESHWDTHIEPLVSSGADLDQGVNQLIDLANHYNGHDNITAIVVRVKVRPNLEHLRQR